MHTKSFMQAAQRWRGVTVDRGLRDKSDIDLVTLRTLVLCDSLNRPGPNYNPSRDNAELARSVARSRRECLVDLDATPDDEARQFLRAKRESFERSLKQTAVTVC